jgi:hypothetical protein
MDPSLSISAARHPGRFLFCVLEMIKDIIDRDTKPREPNVHICGEKPKVRVSTLETRHQVTRLWLATNDEH